jgi:hypothetical protein
MASTHKGYVIGSRLTSIRQDSLARVIRSKKDADEFMAELESAVKRSR